MILSYGCGSHGETGKTKHEWIKEHDRDVWLTHTQISAISEHANTFRHYPLCDHRSESQFKQLQKSPLKLRFTAMVTYSFHLYSRSSHHFILCFIHFTG